MILKYYLSHKCNKTKKDLILKLSSGGDQRMMGNIYGEKLCVKSAPLFRTLVWEYAYYEPEYCRRGLNGSLKVAQQEYDGVGFWRSR